MGSLILAALGTLALIAVAYGLKLRAAGTFASTSEALRKAGLQPDDHPLSTRAQDGRCVLASALDGHLIFIEAIGDKAVVRTLKPADVQECSDGVVIIASSGLGRPAQMVRFDAASLGAVLTGNLSNETSTV